MMTVIRDQEGMFTYLAVIIGGAMLMAWLGIVSMMTPVIGSAHDEVVLNRISYRAEAETFIILKQLMHNPDMYPTHQALTICDTEREKIELLYFKDDVVMTSSGGISFGTAEPVRESNIQMTYTDSATQAAVRTSVIFRWVVDASGKRKIQILQMGMH